MPLGKDRSLSLMLVCIYEDRPQQIPGVKLLVLSLQRHCADWRVRLTVPNPDPSFRSWLRKFDRVELVERKLEFGGSFNVKPTILLDALASGASECVWMDTDVLVNQDPSSLFEVSPETIITTQDPWEYADGSTHRARTWKLDPGRSLPGPLNSAVVRVTPHHRPLLEAWREIMRSGWYLDMQKLPVNARDRHVLSDQDALSALLASREFSEIPVKRLKHPEEILQHHGAGAYSLKERWQTLTTGFPPLFHAMGTVKPWRMDSDPSLLRNPRSYYERYYLELSPYVHAARQYGEDLHEASDWLKIRTALGRVSYLASVGSLSLRGLAQATFQRMAWNIRNRV